MPQSDAYHMTCGTYEAMCRVVGLESSFDSERGFYHVFFAEIFNKYVHSRLVDSPINFLTGFTNNKFKLGFVTPTELPGKTVHGFTGYVLS